MARLRRATFVPTSKPATRYFSRRASTSIGNGTEDSADSSAEIASLYDKLENVIAPLFYQQPDKYAEVRRSTIAINGAFFNTQRMLLQYLSNAYFPADANVDTGTAPARQHPAVAKTSA